MENKRILKILLLFIVVLATFILYSFNSKNGLLKDGFFPSLAYQKNNKGSKNPDSYWSIKNKPVIYGATKITIKKGFVDSFDIKDTRFRVFAKDFEDGDLTNKLTYTGSVDVNTPGTYQIHYKVVDSHGNISTLDVPVIITEEENAKINVERTLYTTPSTWNIDLTGFVRGSRGERQILGIYMPADSSIRIRVLASDSPISISFSANDSALESGVKINNNGEWATIKNTNNGVSYDSVPLFYTSVMARGVDLNKTYKVELEYDDSVKELDYYHQNDNEEAFRKNWIASNNLYSVIENEVITVLAPLTDINMLTNYHRSGFTSLDQFLEYWQKVVDRMDELVGLDLNPVHLTDQNVRTKYFVKANINGGGAAYYGTDHVGVHSPHIHPFFEMNWGGLHEFAHGYQGSLGKGYMGLGEVSNNILGHYIQIDKSIYFHNADWLGDLAKIEENKNAPRLEGKTFQEVDVSTRLYTLINLFDSIDGAKTYTNIFKWYRENLNDKNIADVNNNMDSYVRAISEVYHINIIPYFEDWGLSVSENVKDEVYSKNDKILTILKDVLNEEALTKVLNGEKTNRKYGLISNEALSKYEIKGSVRIKIEMDDITKLYGKKIDIMSGKQIVKTIRLSKDSIKNNMIEIKDLNVGTYYVKMPIVTNYNQNELYVKVSNKEVHTIDYSYVRTQEKDYNNYMFLELRGYTFDSSIALRIAFSDHYTKATITNPNGSRMNGGEYVKIFDQNNKLIFEDVADVGTPGNSNFRAKSAGVYSIAPGYVIEVYYPGKYKDRIRMYSNITGRLLTNYNATNVKTRYIVTSDGIQKEGMSIDEVRKTAYEDLKIVLTGIIDGYHKKATEDALNNRFIDFREKQEVISAYEKLNSTDKELYQEFVSRIIKGGAPEIKFVGKSSYDKNDDIDLYSLISAIDSEDGEIPINKDSTTIDTNINMNKKGVYDVIYHVKDSDQNITTYKATIKVNGKDNPVTPEEPSKPDVNTPEEPEENNKPNPSEQDPNTKPTEEMPNDNTPEHNNQPEINVDTPVDKKPLEEVDSNAEKDPDCPNKIEEDNNPLNAKPVDEVNPIVEKENIIPFVIVLLFICGIAVMIGIKAIRNYNAR